MYRLPVPDVADPGFACVGTHWIRTDRGILKHLTSGDVVVLDLSHSTPDRAPAMLSKFLDDAAVGNLKVVDLASAHVPTD